MTRDIVRENIDCYAGPQALQDWSADRDLYPIEHEIVGQHFPPAPAQVLDLGCGAGRTTIGLEARGYDLDAIDLSESLVAEARRQVQRSRVQLMDARELQFDTGSFDAALFSFNGLDCLHPASERRRVLAEVVRVLRPGGVFYYSGHNGLGAWGPRPGDSLSKLVRRTTKLLLAQRRAFEERTRYLAYPEPNGTQVLYSAPPHVHLRELREAGLAPIAVYSAHGRSYRIGPHLITKVATDPWSWRAAAALTRMAFTAPHLHYVARKPV